MQINPDRPKEDWRTDGPWQDAGGKRGCQSAYRLGTTHAVSTYGIVYSIIWFSTTFALLLVGYVVRRHRDAQWVAARAPESVFDHPRKWVRRLRARLKNRPDDGEARLLLGACLFKLGKYHDILKELKPGLDATQDTGPLVAFAMAQAALCLKMRTYARELVVFAAASPAARQSIEKKPELLALLEEPKTQGGREPSPGYA